MQGKLTMVSGRSGAGKTTMCKSAIAESSEEIQYLETYTTRQRRETDFGYKYVTKEEYVALMDKSSRWDHSEINGEFYGCDVGEMFNISSEGKNLILACYPSVKEISSIKSVYPFSSSGVFIDIPREVSVRRLSLERPSHEIKRVSKEDIEITPELLKMFEFIFKPTNDLEKDTRSFVEIINQIIIR